MQVYEKSYNACT